MQNQNSDSILSDPSVLTVSTLYQEAELSPLISDLCDTVCPPVKRVCYLASPAPGGSPHSKVLEMVQLEAPGLSKQRYVVIRRFGMI